jgi:UDP-N-acetyl-D-glucosamine dehydrogenase
VLILGVAYKKGIDDLRESPSLTIIELLQKEGAQVATTILTSPRSEEDESTICKCASLDDLGKHDCVVIVTDHCDYNYRLIVREAQLVVDSRNATRGIDSPKIVRC